MQHLYIGAQSLPGKESSNFVLQGGFVLHLITRRACRFNPLDDQVRLGDCVNSFPWSDEDSKPVLIFSFNTKSQARRQRGGEVRVSWGWGGTEGGWQLCHSLTLEHQGNLNWATSWSSHYLATLKPSPPSPWLNSTAGRSWSRPGSRVLWNQWSARRRLGDHLST